MGVVSIDTSKLEAKMKITIDMVGEQVKLEMLNREPIDKGLMRTSTGVDKISEYTCKAGGIIDVGTHTGEKYPSFIEYGTDPIEYHNQYVFVKKSETFVGNKLNPELGSPLEEWDALRERKKVEAGQTMPFARTAAFYSEEPIKEIFKSAFR